MWSIEIDTSELVAMAQEADRLLRRETGRAVARACDAGADEAKRSHKFQNRTGELEGSMRGRLTGDLSGLIEATASHASFVEDGTPPHVIEGNPLLAFPGRDGRTVFARKVNHPGTRADHFMQRAEARAEGVLQAGVETAAEEVARMLSK